MDITKATHAGLSVAAYRAGASTLIYPLTECCGASAKGGEDGIECRRCRRDIDFTFGDCIVYPAASVKQIVERVGQWLDYLTDPPGTTTQAATQIVEELLSPTG